MGASMQMLRPGERTKAHRHTGSGLYHVASRPISKYDLLNMIDAELDLGIEVVPADEPVEDRSLRSDRFLEETGIGIPSLEDMIDSLRGDLGRYDEWRTPDGLS